MDSLEQPATGANPLADLFRPAPLTPADRLAQRVTQSKAQAQVKASQQDLLALPAIEQTIASSRERTRMIMERLASLDQRMQEPLPVRSAPRLSQEELVAAGLAMLFGARGDQALGSATELAAQRTALDFQNEAAGYQQRQQGLGRQYEMLSGELANENRIGSMAEAQRIDSLQAADQRSMVSAENELQFQRAEVEKARDRFQRADNEGEVLQAARDLESLGQPVDPQAVELARRQARIRGEQAGIQAYRTLVQPTIDAYQGVYPPGAAERIEQQIREIEARYGIDLPSLVGGPTWKREKEAADQELRRQDLDRKMTEFRQRFKLASDDQAMKHAKWKQDLEIARGRLAVAQRNASTAEGRLELQRAQADVDKTLSKRFEDARETLLKTRADLSAVKAEENQVRNAAPGTYASETERKQELAKIARKRAESQARHDEATRLFNETSVDRERSLATAAIASGVDPDAVRREFRRKTGQNL